MEIGEDSRLPKAGDLHRHNLGVFNADMSQSQSMAGSTISSPQFYEEALLDLEADFSTGYLEDVLLEFSRCKKSKLLIRTTPPSHEDYFLHTSFQSGWTSSNDDHLAQNCCQDFDTLSHMTHDCDGFTAEVKSPEEGIISSETMYDDSSSSSQKESSADHIIVNDSQWTPDEKRNLYSYLDDPMSSSETSSAGIYERRKKRVKMGRVVYPFVLVKPGGFEDEVATLNDINERILMPPTRPVRHPVGDFACRPLLVSPEGPGLSGKTVVAFTRVQTQGRGTITIIRTRG